MKCVGCEYTKSLKIIKSYYEQYFNFPNIKSKVSDIQIHEYFSKNILYIYNYI